MRGCDRRRFPGRSLVHPGLAQRHRAGVIGYRTYGVGRNSGSGARTSIHTADRHCGGSRRRAVRRDTSGPASGTADGANQPRPARCQVPRLLAGCRTGCSGTFNSDVDGVPGAASSRRTTPRSCRLARAERPACIQELRVRRTVFGSTFNRHAVRGVAAIVAGRGSRRDHHTKSGSPGELHPTRSGTRAANPSTTNPLRSAVRGASPS